MYASNLLVPVIIFPYLARVLGVENFGLLMSSQSLAMLVVLLMDYGFNWSASRRLAQSDKSLISVSKIYWVIQASKALLACTGSLLLFIFVVLSPKLSEFLWLYITSWVIIFGSLFSPLWFYQGLEKSNVASIVWILGRIFVLIGIIFCVNSSDDLYLAAFIYALGPIFTGLLLSTYMYVNRVVIFAKPNFPEMVESVKESWSAFVGILFTGGLGHLTTVLITLIAGPIHAGYFSAADRLRQMAVSMLTPLGQALFVKINAISAENYRAAWAYAHKFFMIQMFLGMIIATLIFLFRAELIFFLFGNDLMPASNVLAVMAMGFIFTSLNHSLGFQGMISFGIGSVLWKILLVGFSINVGLVVLLISVFTEFNSEISGALGMLFSEVLVFILLAFFLIKFQKNMYLK